jgi:chaperonin GroEL
MMAKQLIFEEQARKNILSGTTQLAEAIIFIFVPKARNLILDKDFGASMVTEDAVSVAKEIHFKDPVGNMGAQRVKEIASKTVDVAGDGTTTPTIRAAAICRKGLKNVTFGQMEE